MEDFEKKAADLLEKTKADTLKDAQKSASEMIEQKSKDIAEKLVAEAKSLVEGAEKKSADSVEAVKKELNDFASEIRLQIKSGESNKVESKSFGDVLQKAVEDQHDNIEKFKRGERKSFALDLDMKAVGDFSTGNVTGGNVWGAQYRNGIVMNANTKTHIRSLMNVGPAGPGTDFYFMKESGPGEGAPAPTSEKLAAAATTQATGLKPQFDMDLVEASVKFETIAGFLLMSKKSMNNIPGLVNYLNTRITEKLLDVEDAQILYGTGVSPNLKGILTAGNFTQGSIAGPTALSEKIINDLSLLEDTYKRNATGIVMRPSDYYKFFNQKASGSGEYNLPQNVTFVNGVLFISGIEVVKTTALLAEDYLIGDFSGADLLIQEAMRIEFFEQDGTNVRTNQVTVRVEETVALPVYGSDYFIKGSSKPTVTV